MQQKKIIIFLIILFLLSSVYLFVRNDRFKSTEDWWALSFSDPKSNNLNFTIENFTDNPNFHWEETVGKDKINEGDVQIIKNSLKEIEIDAAAQNADKITIRVSSGNEAKEIYKNLK